MHQTVFEMLSQSMATEYANNIAGEIADDVAEDLRSSADENWNDDDLRLAIGRVLCEKMNIDCY